ncbi:MAG TPA: FAD-dependent oxidoreductase [Erysipelotrichaceae bacterium]|nr:FAD-dependent oxidoreductase [Erysipelotrichaceae bacterium]HQB32169.1 FAD-dependent oxidoreductase [Erysipelotrichaceae bacterium]
MDSQFEIIIVGAGPAGLTAAIYASRANMKVLLLEQESPGGKLVKTYKIENYTGVQSSSGVDLAMSFMNHGLAFGAEIDFGEVVKVESSDKIKRVVLADGREFTAKAVIVATGTKERPLDVAMAERFTGRGISYCAVCDGAFYRDKVVTIIGGGNSALEEALFITSLVEKVNIVIRRDQFRAEPKVVEEVLKNEKINVIYKHLPDSLIIEDNNIVGLNIRHVDTKEVTPLMCSGIFPYIGADPATSFLDKAILNERGYILAKADMSTAIEGIFGAGDVIDKDLRQVVTATSDGAIAANSAVKYIKNNF